MGTTRIIDTLNQNTLERLDRFLRNHVFPNRSWQFRELYRKNWDGWSVAVWRENVLDSIQTLKRQ